MVPVFIATQLGQNLPLLQQASAATVLLTLPVIGIGVISYAPYLAILSALELPSPAWKWAVGFWAALDGARGRVPDALEAVQASFARHGFADAAVIGEVGPHSDAPRVILR